MKLLLPVFLALLSLLNITCSTSKSGKQTENHHGKLVYNSCEFSSDSLYVACVKKLSNESGLSNVSIYIVDIDSMVFEENMKLLKLEWIDKYKVEIQRELGLIADNNGREISILDVKTGERRIVSKINELK